MTLSVAQPRLDQSETQTAPHPWGKLRPRSESPRADVVGIGEGLGVLVPLETCRPLAITCHCESPLN